MRKGIVIGSVAAASAAGLAFAVLPAVADGADGGNAGRDVHGMDHAMDHAMDAPSAKIGSLSAVNRQDAVFFAASLDGANEVPVAGGPAVGDQDGHALALLRVQGDELSFALSWRGIGTPTLGHIHQGAKGANGAVRIPLFTEKLRDGSKRVTGTVKVTDRQLLQALRTDPAGFYVNLHTAGFPGGAVRGQTHRLDAPLDMGRVGRSFQASVVRGQQVYTCTRQQDGSYAFTQDNVSARLDGGIRHFFAQPGPAGPPEWLAPDRSAVTGKVLARIPNGETNIPELELAATRAGKRHGLLAHTTEVLRLNTRGGVAPSGTCDPQRQPRVGVGYRADYVFIGR